MINLCGFAISNYYNKTKLVLLEKGIAFTEEQVFPSQDEALLKRSPLGKIPFIETERGCLSESQVILEYLEETYPEKPLYPADSFKRAKCRELIQNLELNVELHARRLYKEAFFGGTVSEEIKNEVKERLTMGLKGLARLGACRTNTNWQPNFLWNPHLPGQLNPHSNDWRAGFWLETIRLCRHLAPIAGISLAFLGYPAANTCIRFKL